MSGLTTDACGAVLKEVYAPNIRNQLNKKTRILDDFTKADIDQLEWEGKQVVVALHKSRNVGVKAVAESGLLPAAGAQGYAKLVIPMRFWEGRIQLTAQVLKAARSNKGSFARAMDSEQSGLVLDISRQRNRALWGAGKGILALAGTGATSATLPVTAPGGVTGATNGVRFLTVGMMIAIYDAAGTTLVGVRTIASVDSDSQVTLDSSITFATSAVITLGATDGTSPEGASGIEPVGLLGIVDTTTYLTSIHGIDRSTAANAFFKSIVLASVGAISDDYLQRAIDNTEEVGGEVIDTFYCHNSVRREILKMHQADRRYTVDKQKPDVGTAAGVFKADLTYGQTIPIKTEKDAPYGKLFGLNKSHLYWIPEVEGEWADEDGAVLSRVSGKDAYEGYFRVFENFFSDKGNSHFRMDDITATVTAGIYAD